MYVFTTYKHTVNTAIYRFFQIISSCSINVLGPIFTVLTITKVGTLKSTFVTRTLILVCTSTFVPTGRAKFVEKQVKVLHSYKITVYQIPCIISWFHIDGLTEYQTFCKGTTNDKYVRSQI